MIQAPSCARGIGAPGVPCSCAACKPPKKIFARGHLLFSEAQEGSCFTAEVEHDLLRIRELERAAEIMAKKLRLVSPVGFAFLSSVVPRHYSRPRAFVESLETQTDDIFLDNTTLFPPLVGLGDGEEWVEFLNADECSDCDVRSVGEEEEEWMFAGVSVTDRLKPTKAMQSMHLDFKRALLSPPPTHLAHRQASKNVARRNPKAISPRVVLQALWREDVMAEEEEEREEYLSSSDEELDSADASRWGRQFGAVRKSRSHAMASLLTQVLAPSLKARQARFQVVR